MEDEDYEAFCGGKEVDRDISGLEEVGLGLGRIGVQVSPLSLPLVSPVCSCWVSEAGTDPETRCDQELEALLGNSDEAATVDLIDVRTPEQFSIVSIPGSRSAHLLLLVFP